MASLQIIGRAPEALTCCWFVEKAKKKSIFVANLCPKDFNGSSRIDLTVAEALRGAGGLLVATASDIVGVVLFCTLACPGGVGKDLNVVFLLLESSKKPEISPMVSRRSASSSSKLSSKFGDLAVASCGIESLGNPLWGPPSARGRVFSNPTSVSTIGPGAEAAWSPSNANADRGLLALSDALRRVRANPGPSLLGRRVSRREPVTLTPPRPAVSTPEDPPVGSSSGRRLPLRSGAPPEILLSSYGDSAGPRVAGPRIAPRRRSAVSIVPETEGLPAPSTLDPSTPLYRARNRAAPCLAREKRSKLA